MSSCFSPIIPSSPQGLCVPLHHQYLGEVSPKKLRGFANSTASFFWSLGKATGQIAGQRYSTNDLPPNSYLDLLYLLLPPLLLRPLLSLLKKQCNELLFYTHVFYPLQGAAGQSLPVARADGLLWNSCPGPAAHPALLP